MERLADDYARRRPPHVAASTVTMSGVTYVPRTALRRWALVLLTVAGIVAASSIVRGRAPYFVPFRDAGFQGRVGVVLVRTGFAALAMVAIGLVLLMRGLRPYIGRLAEALAAAFASASLVTSSIGIVTHYDDARPWEFLERGFDDIHLPAAMRLVGEDHVARRSHDGSPLVRRTWAAPPTQGRDETCVQLKEALTPLRGASPPEINPGRCDLYVRLTKRDVRAWLDNDRDPDTQPTPTQLRGATRFVVIEVVAI